MKYERVPAPKGKDYGVRAFSEKRRMRRALMAEAGITSGRQWVRLRRWLRQEARQQAAT